MSMTINELEDKWNSISPYSGGFLLVSGNHPLSFHIGYFGEKMCFIVLDTGKRDHINSSKSISADCVQTEDQKYALKFLLNYNSLKELFVKLCWDLIDCSRESTKPVDDILIRFNNWIRLLQKKGEGLLSSSAQKGLIGELLFLKKALKTYSAREVIAAWVGPEGSDQDYIFPNRWYEIKTTTIAGTSVTISSLQQLDREDEGELVVYYMDRTTAHGAYTLSLPQVVTDVELALNDDRLIDVLFCKLAMYGYYDKDADRYRETDYRFAGESSYKVTQGFPKMVRSNVPNAVQNAKYDLALSAIEEYKIEGE